MKILTKKWKPNDLALIQVEDRHVEGDKRIYVGEVMSHPTPGGTIMVRRVPDHPGTLEEVPLVNLLSPDDSLYVHYAQVESRFEFPADMLRYDTCVPVNFTLEENERGRLKIKIDPAFGFDKPVVAGASRKKAVYWCFARWASFSVILTPIKTLKIKSCG